jgi:hypothetical protein
VAPCLVVQRAVPKQLVDLLPLGFDQQQFAAAADIGCAMGENGAAAVNP